MRTPQQLQERGGSMEGYDGFVPVIWKRIKQYRFRDTYQTDRRYYPRRRRKAVMKSARLGKRSWGLKIPKLRICVVSPVSFFNRIKDVYMRMVMSLTGKKNTSQLAYGSYTCALTKSGSRRIEATSSDNASSVVYLDYLLK